MPNLKPNLIKKVMAVTQNMGLRKKILAGFIVVFAFILLFSAISIISVVTINKKSSFIRNIVYSHTVHLLEIESNAKEIISNVNSSIDAGTSMPKAKIEKLRGEITNEITEHLSDTDDKYLTGAVRSLSLKTDEYIALGDEFLTIILTQRWTEVAEQQKKFKASEDEILTLINRIKEQEFQKLDASLVGVVSLTDRTIYISVFIMLVTLLAGVSLAFFVGEQIISPIKSLMNVSKEAERGNFKVRSDIYRSDEIGRLSEGLNQMLENIQARDEELEVHRNYLEELVARKTDDLAKANEQLLCELEERKRMEEKLRRSDEFSRLVLDSMADSISIIDTSDYRIVAVNRVFLKEVGLPLEKVIGKKCYALTHHRSDPCELSDDPCPLLNVVEEGGHFKVEHVHYRDNGQKIYMEVSASPIKDASGKVVQIIHVARDISRQKIAEEQLKHKAFYDELTSLPNRDLFLDRLHNVFERKKRYQEYLFAVIFLDIDRFKVINDTLGHLAGNQLLTMVAQRLRNSVRAVDTVARFGGDEFAILLDDIKNKNDVHIVANRINDEISPPFILENQEFYVSLSMGVVLSELIIYHNPEDLLRDADTAMYAAKDRGRACHVIFDISMHETAMRDMRLESELRKSVEQNEFVLHYHPIMSIRDNKIIGLEALLRWNPPQRGLTMPSEFLQVAEDTGLIVQIGQWVLHEACRQMSEWQKTSSDFNDFTISVNISPKEFSQPNFVEVVKETLRSTGLRAESLRLEITEKMIISNYEYAAGILNQLKELKVKIDIDDFGTGHSALSYLMNLPINALKIAPSFTRRSTAHSESREIARTIINLAHNMKMSVVTEGIETTDELSLFKEMKSEYAQGYLFSRPLDSKAIEALLKAG